MCSCFLFVVLRGRFLMLPVVMVVRVALRVVCCLLCVVGCCLLIAGCWLLCAVVLFR